MPYFYETECMVDMSFIYPGLSKQDILYLHIAQRWICDSKLGKKNYMKQMK